MGGTGVPTMCVMAGVGRGPDSSEFEQACPIQYVDSRARKTS